MSHKPSQIIEAAYRDFRSDGVEAFAEHWTDDIIWHAMGGSWDGKEDGCRYLHEQIEVFDGYTTETLDLFDVSNERAVIYIRYGGRMKRTGVEIPHEYFAVVIDVRDGKIAHAQEYATRDEAVQAAG